MATLFGYEIRKKKGDEGLVAPSPIAPQNKDGAQIVTNYGVSGGYYSIVANADVDPAKTDEIQLIQKYRDCSSYCDADTAIDEIVNEAIVIDGEDKLVQLNLDSIDDKVLPKSIKQKLQDELQNILMLLDFQRNGSDIFRQWYVDGRLYLHPMFVPQKEKEGIAEIRVVDPRKIKRIKEVKKERDPATGQEILSKEIREYYLYNDSGINVNTTTGIMMSVDSIVHVTSGLLDSTGGVVLSYLHKAIKFINMLKMMEDALVIYRYTRAPERRVIYVDVGTLPPASAEKYVASLMAKFKNKISYDSTTGEIKDTKNNLSMMEDFWMPRREGGKGTEITTLPGGQSLGQIEDINYFQNKVYQSLNVPLGRMQPQQTFSLGRSAEISRDEVRFNKFITKLRARFNLVFLGLLKLQIISKGIMSLDAWNQISGKIGFIYNKDNYFSELKESEILTQKLTTLQMADQFVGKYFSKKFVMKNIMKFSDEEIEDEEEQMMEEMPEEENVADGTEDEGEQGQQEQQPTQSQPQQQASSNQSYGTDQPLVGR